MFKLYLKINVLIDQRKLNYPKNSLIILYTFNIITDTLIFLFRNI